MIKIEKSDAEESLILSVIKNVAYDLEQEGWNCVIGEINPLKENSDLKSPSKLEPYGFSSLSIVDIEHRLVQYLYVFFEGDNLCVMGDENSNYNKKTLKADDITPDSLNMAIRKVTNLGV